MTKRVVTFEIPFDSNPERNAALMRMSAHEAVEYGDAVCDNIEYTELEGENREENVNE